MINDRPYFNAARTPGSSGRYTGEAPPGAEDEQPVKLLDRKHPDYEARKNAWTDLALLYESGDLLKQNADRFLKQRPSEDQEVYAARLDRFFDEGILPMALGWYGAAMFETDPEIFFNGDGGSQAYADFLKNCDGAGTSFINFSKRLYQMLLTYGSAWVLTDTRPLRPGEEPPLTAEEERQRGFLDPHLSGFSPLHVINWQLDAQGQLDWVLLRTENQEQAFLSEPEMVTTWYYYDRTEYKVYEYRRKKEEQLRAVSDDYSGRMAQLIRKGNHALSHVGRVPVRRLIIGGGLWLANRAYLLIVEHLNQDNTLSWALFMSNLAIPVIIGGDKAPSDVKMSETGYLWFPEKTKYQWTEPEGKSFDQSARRIEYLREECFRSMSLQAQGRSMKATPSMQSGRSKLLDMAPARQILSGMGDDLREAMQDILIDVRDARHEPNVNPDVRGFVFDDKMSTEEVFALSSVLSLGIPSRTFEKSVMKSAAATWMPDANREELSIVYNEIDAGPTIAEAELKELKDRSALVQSKVSSALAAKTGVKPPGRGGAGPAVNSEDNGKEEE